MTEASVAETTAFWGTDIAPGEGESISIHDGEVLQVNMISLGPNLKDEKGRTVVSVQVGDRPQRFAVCSLLPGRIESYNVSLIFVGEETVKFSVTGKNAVYLTGSFQFGLESDDEDEEDMADLVELANADMGEEDDEEEDESDDEDADGFIPPKIIDEDPPIIKEITDDRKSTTPTEATVMKKKKKKGKKQGEKNKSQDADVEMMEVDVQRKAFKEKTNTPKAKGGAAEKREREEGQLISPPSKKKKVSERVATPAPKKHMNGLKHELNASATPEGKTVKKSESEGMKSAEAAQAAGDGGASPSKSKRKRKRKRGKGKGAKPAA